MFQVGYQRGPRECPERSWKLCALSPNPGYTPVPCRCSSVSLIISFSKKNSKQHYLLRHIPLQSLALSFLQPRCSAHRSTLAPSFGSWAETQMNLQFNRTLREIPGQGPELILSRKHQNHNYLLNNHQEQMTGTYQKKIIYYQRQKKKPEQHGRRVPFAI